MPVLVAFTRMAFGTLVFGLDLSNIWAVQEAWLLASRTVNMGIVSLQLADQTYHKTEGTGEHNYALGTFKVGSGTELDCRTPASIGHSQVAWEQCHTGAGGSKPL